MKKVPRLTSVFLLLILAIIGGVQRADADTINTFTGTWNMSCEGYCASPWLYFQSLGGLHGLFGSIFDGFFSFDGSVTDYSDDHGCDQLFPCTSHWSGRFDGGSVSFVATDNQGLGLEYSFTGMITGGSFSGTYTCDSSGCFGSNNAMLSFTSTWTNGWRSEGTLNVTSDLGDLPRGSSGPLSMTTVTPELDSVTLLGSGIIGIAIFLRRGVKEVAALGFQYHAQPCRHN